MQTLKGKVWLNPFLGGTDRYKLKFWSFLIRSLGMIIGSAGFAVSLTLIYHAMQGVMKLGGFVASGQTAYKIVHYAPDWIWIFPVSFFGGAFCILINNLNARRIGGLNLLIMMWPALFISLGYNFLYFAYNPPNNQSEVVIGWLICGVLFMLMGGLPFIMILKNIFVIIGQIGQKRALLEEGRSYYENDGGSYMPPRLAAFFVFIFCTGSLGGGVYLGIKIFQKLAG